LITLTPAKAFRILGLPQRATAEQIKSRHRELIRTLHPDVNATLAAAKRVREVNAARDCLLTKDSELSAAANLLQNPPRTVVHHQRVQQPGFSFEVIIARGTNAAMAELLRQVSQGELNVEKVIDHGLRTVRKGVMKGGAK
jgi:DnaJ-class molecular chaperone